MSSNIDLDLSTDYLEYILGVGECIRKCRNLLDPNNKSKISTATIILAIHLIKLISKSDGSVNITGADLCNILKCEQKRLSERLIYFKSYGLGEFIYTGRKELEIKIENDNGDIKKITYPKFSYTFYFNEKFLSILEEEKILEGKLNFQNLTQSISLSEKLLKAIENKEDTVKYNFTQEKVIEEKIEKPKRERIDRLANRTRREEVARPTRSLNTDKIMESIRKNTENGKER